MRNLYEQINLLKRFDDLIKRKSTGAPEDLARRCNISRASTFRNIETLKKFGAPIRYCRDSQSYYYEDEDFELKF